MTALEKRQILILHLLLEICHSGILITFKEKIKIIYSFGGTCRHQGPQKSFDSGSNITPLRSRKVSSPFFVIAFFVGRMKSMDSSLE